MTMRVITDDLVRAARDIEHPTHVKHFIAGWSQSPRYDVVNASCSCGVMLQISGETLHCQAPLRLLNLPAEPRCACGKPTALNGHCSPVCMRAAVERDRQAVRPCGCHGDGWCSRCAPAITPPYDDLPKEAFAAEEAEGRRSPLWPTELGEASAVAEAPAFKFQRGPRITHSED